MSGRFFLDTGVFVSCFDRDAPARARRAYQLIRQAVSTRKGTTSCQVAQEFFRLAFGRFEQPMTPAEAERFLAVVFRPLLPVQVSPALLGEALRLAARERLAWRDALVVAAALQAECETLFSEDLPHGQRIGELRVQNPFL
jgi:predicted nucleic acid-binding protein